MWSTAGAAQAQLTTKDMKAETTKLCFKLGAEAEDYFECRYGMKAYALLQKDCKYRPTVHIDDATLTAMSATNSKPLDFLDDIFSKLGVFCSFEDRPNKAKILAQKIKAITVRLQPLPKPTMIEYDTGRKSPEYPLGH